MPLQAVSPTRARGWKTMGTEPSQDGWTPPARPTHHSRDLASSGEWPTWTPVGLVGATARHDVAVRCPPCGSRQPGTLKHPNDGLGMPSAMRTSTHGLGKLVAIMGNAQMATVLTVSFPPT